MAKGREEVVTNLLQTVTCIQKYRELYCTVLYCAVLYYTVLYCAVLCVTYLSTLSFHLSGPHPVAGCLTKQIIYQDVM